METMDQGAVAAAIERDERGGWFLQVHYTGLLAGCESVWVRLGEHRHGAVWLNVRDVELEHREGEEAVARIPLAPGDPVDGAELAFFTAGSERTVWDNAGHPFGYYEVDARSGAVEVR